MDARTRTMMSAATACAIAATLAVTHQFSAATGAARLSATATTSLTPDVSTPLRNPTAGWVLTFDDNKTDGLDADSYWTDARVRAVLQPPAGSGRLPIGSALYIRTTWAALEPTAPVAGQHTYAWNQPDSPITKLVTHAKAYHLQIALQVMTDSKNRTDQATPDWVFTKSRPDHTEPGSTRKEPDLDDPNFQYAYMHFIADLGAKFDDPRTVSYVDLGLGVNGDAQDLNQVEPIEDKAQLWRTVTDAYSRAFPHVPLVLNYVQNGAFDQTLLDAALATRHYLARSSGLGIPDAGALTRLNTRWPASASITEYGFAETNSHAAEFEKYYNNTPDPGTETAPGIGAAHRRALIDAASYHANTLNLGTPSDMKSWSAQSSWLLNWFTIRGGYRLAPISISIPVATRGAAAQIRSVWQNSGIGVLPQWNGKYRIAYTLLDSSNKPVPKTMTVDTRVDPGAWINSHANEVTTSMTLPRSGVSAGTYTLAVGIVDTSQHNSPAIQLATTSKSWDSDGRAPDSSSAGWYEVGTITVN